MNRYVGGTFASLHVREFAILWAGSLLTFTAFFMSTVVQAIVAFELTGKNGAVGVVLLGQGVAMAALGPLGGTIADRLSKKAINVICQAVIALTFLAIGLLVAFDNVRILYLAIGSFSIGTMFAFVGPARQAWVVDLVGPELRANAVAVSQVALNASRVVAPAIAGALVALAFVGAAGAYFVMAALYAIATLSLVLLPGPTATARNERSVFGDLVAGLGYVKSQPRLRAMMGLFFFMIVLGLAATGAVLPGLVENELGRSVESIGSLQAVAAVGGLVASLLVAPMAGSSRALPVYTVLGFASGLSLLLLGLAPSFLIALLPMLLFGAMSGGFQTLNMSVIVLESEPAYYGRVTSLTSLAFAGFMLASFPVGVLADAVGERATLVALGLVNLVAVVVMAPLIARAPSAATMRERADARACR
ncbi:MAG: MFS transporter, partial [Chloroflexi bacterium]|nr:MFS transporter [Chloroflexota bacterium]